MTLSWRVETRSLLKRAVQGATGDALGRRIRGRMGFDIGRGVRGCHRSGYELRVLPAYPDHPRILWAGER